MKKIVLIIAALMCAAGVFAQQNLQPAAIVTLTKAEPITVKQFKDQITTMEKMAGRTLTAAERRQILDGMINERLAMQAAAKAGIKVTDDEINTQMQDLRNQLAQGLGHRPSDTEFASAIQQQYGMSLAEFQAEARKTLTLQHLVATRKRSLFESLAEPTDADINKAFQLQQSNLTQPETVNFAAIYVPFAKNSGTPTAADKAKAKAEIDRLARQIGGNVTKFDELVQAGQGTGQSYQSDPAGALANNPKGHEDVGDAFFDRAFDLQQGVVSEVLEIPQGKAAGYYIIKVTAKYPKRFLTLDDKIPGTNGTVRQYIAMSLFQQKQMEILEKAQSELVADLRKEGKVQIMEKNIAF